MKKMFLTLFVAVGLMSVKSSAQVSINVNIGSQPLWAPVGYDYVDYYYLPDIETYYYVPKRQFIYMDNGRWNFSFSLPARYRDYDLDRGYKVVINSRDAYRNFNRDRVRYAKYIGVRNQRIIRYSKSPRYQEVKAHPHGLAPGRAKKTYYAERNDNHDHRRSNEHGNSRSHGRGKH